MKLAHYAHNAAVRSCETRIKCAPDAHVRAARPAMRPGASCAFNKGSMFQPITRNSPLLLRNLMCLWLDRVGLLLNVFGSFLIALAVGKPKERQ